jgi:hypothetical protein
VLLRGVAHVHSTYSYDGCHGLAELVRFFKARRLDFALMSEHNRGLTGRDVAAFVAECAGLSDDSFLVVPGLECEAVPDHVHVLAYGVRALIDTDEPAVMVRSIRKHGGLAVLAHPHWRDGFAHGESVVDLLHGWEVWNGKADGSWSPRAESIERYTRQRTRRPHLLPLAGADLHRLESYPDITLEVQCDRRNVGGLMAALASGTFRAVGRGFAFRADGPVSTRAGAVLRGHVVRTVRRWTRHLDRRLGRSGVSAPAPIYRLARRLLK